MLVRRVIFEMRLWRAVFRLLHEWREGEMKAQCKQCFWGFWFFGWIVILLAAPFACSAQMHYVDKFRDYLESKP